jgi:hypothetical protein
MLAMIDALVEFGELRGEQVDVVIIETVARRRLKGNGAMTGLSDARMQRRLNASGCGRGRLA